MLNIKWAYAFAFQEIRRKPGYWSLISLLYVLFSLSVCQGILNTALIIMFIFVKIAITNAALKAALRQPYGIKNWLPERQKTVRCFGAKLLLLPITFSISYIIDALSGSHELYLAAMFQFIVFVLLFRLAFNNFFLLLMPMKIWKGLTVSWKLTKPSLLKSFILVAIINTVLTLPGLLADVYCGLPINFWSNWVAPIISLLALAHLFTQTINGVTIQTKSTTA